jgi:hypothetical protein
MNDLVFFFLRGGEGGNQDYLFFSLGRNIETRNAVHLMAATIFAA